ncbi:RHS repeat-associated core domain-containing protein [Paenibacillus sp. M1]|uniref:Lysozyme n=1 Tax=Paenibacillus haidiansis TaxID=1574488 RepID=A0ABU7VM11_9BACL
MIKRVLSFILTIVLISMGFLETSVYGAREENQKIASTSSSIAQENTLTISGIINRFDVDKAWVDEQLSQGYTLYQIYTALQSGKENYEAAISQFNVSREVEKSMDQLISSTWVNTRDLSSNNSESNTGLLEMEGNYDQNAIDHLSLQDDYSLYEVNYGEDMIATATGDMKLRYEDFSLPGTLSFSLVRIYDSSRANDEIGIALENGTYVNQTRIRREESDSALGRGWSWELPFIEKLDDNQILNFPGIGRYKLSEDWNVEGYPWNDLELTEDQTMTVGELSSKTKLSILNGNQYYFSESGHLILITDNYGNQIEFHYTSQGDGVVLSRVVNSDGNELIFAYSEESLTVSQTGTDRKMEYLKKIEHGQTVLDEVIDSLDRSTKYYYYYPESRFNFLAELEDQEELQPVKYSALLLRIVHPTSGITDFDYIPARKKIGDYATDFVFKISDRKDLYSTTLGDELLHPLSLSYSGEDLNSFGQSVTWTTTLTTSRSTETLNFRKSFRTNDQPDIHYLDEQRSDDGVTQHKQQFTYDEVNGWNAPSIITESNVQGGSESQPISVTYQYNDKGLVVAENWSTGQEILYEYSESVAPYFSALPSQIQTKISENKKRFEQFLYNEQGSVTHSTVRENNSSGKLLAQSDYEYDAYGNIIEIKIKDDNRTNKVNYSYQSPYGKHLLTEQSLTVHSVDGVSSQIKQRYEYTPAGEIKTAEDEAGAITTFTYDALGRNTKILYSDQSTSTIQFDDELNSVTTTGPEGIITIEKYNPIGLLTQEIMDDALFQYNYDEEGNLRESVDAEQNKTQFIYDGFSRLTKTIYADGSQDEVEYDLVNQTITYSDPAGVKQRERLDLLGNTLAVEEWRDGSFSTLVQNSYDLDGNVISVTNGNGQQTMYEYDALGRLISVIDPEQRSTDYIYSLAGNLTKIQYPDNTYVEKEYDEAGKLIRQVNEEKATEAFYYDSRGNLSKASDHSGQFTEYQYNDDNLLTLIRTPDQQVQYTYDAMGRRTSMTDSTGSTSYTYDSANGALLTVNYPDGTVIGYTYNKQTRTGYSLTDTTGKTTTARYTLDNMNRVNSLDVLYNQLGTRSSLASNSSLDRISFDYRANGSLELASSEDGPSTSFTYDGYNLKEMSVEAQTVTSSVSATEATYEINRASQQAAFNGYEFAYEYDSNKNIISRTQNGATDYFAYDSINRIQSETGQGINKKYTYDERGNRLNVEGQQARGLTSADFTFDSLNRLSRVKVEGGTEVSYVYNGDGLLYERVEGEQRTRYYYDEEAKLIAEANVSSGTPIISYTYIYDLSGRLWSRVDQTTGEMQYYQFNGHGDVVGLTDSQGNQLNTYTYDIWGNPEIEEETVPNVFRYSGEYWDNTTDLQYLRARWYDPNAGRFVSKDSYEGEISNPLSLNLYSYVENNPLIYTDPSGHKLYVEADNKGKFVYTISANMQVSDEYIKFVMDYETYHRTPYRGQDRQNLTIGYGHVIKKGEDFGDGLTQQQAMELLKKDINERAIVINQWADENKIELNQQQFDAIVDFAFNIGIGAFYDSTFARLMKSGNSSSDELKEAMMLFVKVNKENSFGLYQRRMDQWQIFYSGDYKRDTFKRPPGF